MHYDRYIFRGHSGICMAALVVTAGILIAAPLPADGPPMSGDDYVVTEYTIESAGGIAAGGSYEVHAGIGQVDAHEALETGAYALEGGFWPGGKGAGDTVFKDGFE